MELSSSQELFNDNTKLESKVVLALSRILTMSKCGRIRGVSVRQIVEYLINNYCSLDGDIESQVMTALLSCVKAGHVCVLDNGKYLRPDPGSKGVISKCITKTSHGPRCHCFTTIKRMSRKFQKPCCSMNASSGSGRKFKKRQSKSPGVTSLKRGKGRTMCKKKVAKCAQKFIDKINNYNFRKPQRIPMCKYCLEKHAKKDGENNFCSECNASGTGFVIPFDQFSPRDALLCG